MHVRKLAVPLAICLLILWIGAAQAQDATDGYELSELNIWTIIVILLIISVPVFLVSMASRNIKYHREKIYRSGYKLRIALFIIIVLISLSHALLIPIVVWQNNIISKIQIGELIDEAEALRSDRALQLATIASVILVIVGGVLFLSWISRVRANLPALGVHDARWGPGWAVGWWFIPLMNLFRPFQVMAEVYRASVAEVAGLWQYQPASKVGWWWFFWIAAASTSGGANGLARRAEEAYERGRFERFFDNMILSNKFDIATSALTIAGSILLLAVIVRTDRCQTAKAGQIAMSEHQHD